MLRTSGAAAFGLGIPGILPGPEASQPRSLRPTLALSPSEQACPAEQRVGFLRLAACPVCELRTSVCGQTFLRCELGNVHVWKLCRCHARFRPRRATHSQHVRFGPSPPPATAPWSCCSSCGLCGHTAHQHGTLGPAHPQQYRHGCNCGVQLPCQGLSLCGAVGAPAEAFVALLRLRAAVHTHTPGHLSCGCTPTAHAPALSCGRTQRRRQPATTARHAVLQADGVPPRLPARGPHVGWQQLLRPRGHPPRPCHALRR